jgi:hypothetical protein
MQYRRCTLLIALAIGLALLEFGIYNLPDNVRLPGEIFAALFLIVAFYWLIPAAILGLLVAAVFSLPDKTEKLPILRFAIRDLLWLTLVVATGAGWFAHISVFEATRLKVEKVHNEQMQRFSQHLINAKALEDARRIAPPPPPSTTDLP